MITSVIFYAFFDSSLNQNKKDKEKRKKECDELISRMSEMNDLWAESARGLANKDYGNYLIDNPNKAESSFIPDVLSNTKQEALSAASFLAGSIPGLSLGISVLDIGKKYTEGDRGGALLSGATSVATGAEWYFKSTSSTAAWRGFAAAGLKRASYVGAAYTGYSILWDPYVRESKRQWQPDQIVNPNVTNLEGSIRGAEQGIEFYSNKYRELNCAEFY